MADIFISYARRDQPVAAALVKEIERRTGRAVWWDRSNGDGAAIEPGSDFEAKIRKELSAASYCVVLLSPDSLASAWVRDEVSRARELKLQVIPVKIAEFDQKDLPLGLSLKQRIDLHDWVPSTDSPELDRLIDIWTSGWRHRVTPFFVRVRRLVPLALPFVILVFLLNLLGVFELLGIDTELSFVTLSARSWGSARRIDPRLKLVVIDETTDQQIAAKTDVDRWRAEHARAMRQLSKAAVIAYDITFEANPQADAGTRQLAAAIHDVRGQGANVVIAVRGPVDGPTSIEPLLRTALREPLPSSSGAGALGHACMSTGGQHVTSYLPLLAKRDGQAPIVSLALSAVEPKAKAVPKSERDDQISLVTTEEDRSLQIVGYDPPVVQGHCPALDGFTPARYYLDVFPYDTGPGDGALISFQDVLQPSFDARRIAGKIVLVGSRRRTEDQQLVWDSGLQTTAGMNVQAAAINTLLSKAFIRPVGPGLQLVWLGVLSLLAALIRDQVPATKRLERAGLLLCLVLLDIALAGALSLVGLLSEVPYHLVVIGLSYLYLIRSPWFWRRLRFRIRTHTDDPEKGEARG